jgi:hypothetical protein
MTRIGKIARLPAEVREALNERLKDGQPASLILPWLNALPETQAALKDYFDGKAINDANLSAWRNGGYSEWLKRQGRVGEIRKLSELAYELAAANGGNIAKGAMAIAGGQLLGILEAATSEDKKLPMDEIRDIVSSLNSLRTPELAEARVDVDREKLKQKDEELKLAREKFPRDTATMVLKSARDEAVQKIASQPGDYSNQIEAVGKHLFGDLWK